jgi:hypothetical protein
MGVPKCESGVRELKKELLRRGGVEPRTINEMECLLLVSGSDTGRNLQHLQERIEIFTGDRNCTVDGDGPVANQHTNKNETRSALVTIIHSNLRMTN